MIQINKKVILKRLLLVRKITKELFEEYLLLIIRVFTQLIAIMGITLYIASAIQHRQLIELINNLQLNTGVFLLFIYLGVVSQYELFKNIISRITNEHVKEIAKTDFYNQTISTLIKDKELDSRIHSIIQDAISNGKNQAMTTTVEPYSNANTEQLHVKEGI